MLETARTIFISAAPIQRSVFLLLTTSLLLSCGIALSRPFVRLARLDRLIPLLVAACPMLGVVCSALNGLHMMQTVVQLPISVTLQMLAPGCAEMAAFVLVGCLAGLAALLAHFAITRLPAHSLVT